MLGVPKNGTTTHVVVPSQHKHKIKHDKTTMQSFLSMPGRHKYYLRRDIPKIIKFKATNSLRVSCLFCIFKHSPQKTV